MYGVEGGLLYRRVAQRPPEEITRRWSKVCSSFIEGVRVLAVSADQIHDGSAVDWLRRLMFEQGAEVAPF